MGLLDDAIREHLELKLRHGAAEDEVRRQEREALGPPVAGEVPEALLPRSAQPVEPPSEEYDLPAGATWDEDGNAIAYDPQTGEQDWAEVPAPAPVAPEPPLAPSSYDPQTGQPLYDTPSSATGRHDVREVPASSPYMREPSVPAPPPEGEADPVAPIADWLDVDPLPGDEGYGRPTQAFSAADVAEAAGSGSEAPTRSPAPAGEPGGPPSPPPPAADDPDAPDVLDQTPEFLEETPEHDRLWFEQKPPRDFDFD